MDFFIYLEFQRRVLSLLKENNVNRKVDCQCPCSCGARKEIMGGNQEFVRVETLNDFHELEEKIKNKDEFNLLVRQKLYFFLLI